MEDFLKEHLGELCRLRDPIYGYIYLSKIEQKIIDTPLFQRLRRIHQLALTKYVYPMAENSRFAHSLGAMHCATALYRGARTPKRHDDIADCIHLRLAALMHDIGHLPFSHAVESFLLRPAHIEHPLVKIKHEQVGQFLIENHPDLCAILDEKRKPVIRILSKEEQRPKERILTAFISGQLDADRADYLLRDSHSCGVQYGVYDFERYQKAFTIRNGPNGRKYLEVKERDIFVVESFLLARYHYNLQVPYHRTRTGFDLVLNRYFSGLNEKDCLPELLEYNSDGSIKSIKYEDFEDFDDYRVIEWIKADYRRHDPYAKILLRLDHIVPILDVSSCHFSDRKSGKLRLEEFRTALTEQGFLENDDFFVYENDIALSKFPGLLGANGSDEPEDDPFSIQVLCNDKSRRDIKSFSQVVRSMAGSLELYRLYAMPDKASEIAAIGKKLHIPGVVDLSQHTEV